MPTFVGSSCGVASKCQGVSLESGFNKVWFSRMCCSKTAVELVLHGEKIGESVSEKEIVDDLNSRSSSQGRSGRRRQILDAGAEAAKTALQVSLSPALSAALGGGQRLSQSTLSRAIDQAARGQCLQDPRAPKASEFTRSSRRPPGRGDFSTHNRATWRGATLKPSCGGRPWLDSRVSLSGIWTMRRCALAKATAPWGTVTRMMLSTCTVRK